MKAQREKTSIFEEAVGVGLMENMFSYYIIYLQ